MINRTFLSSGFCHDGVGGLLNLGCGSYGKKNLISVSFISYFCQAMDFLTPVLSRQSLGGRPSLFFKNSGTLLAVRHLAGDDQMPILELFIQ
jgi:hypothetical protein